MALSSQPQDLVAERGAVVELVHSGFDAQALRQVLVHRHLRRRGLRAGGGIHAGGGVSDFHVQHLRL